MQKIKEEGIYIYIYIYKDWNNCHENTKRNPHYKKPHLVKKQNTNTNTDTNTNTSMNKIEIAHLRREMTFSSVKKDKF